MPDPRASFEKLIPEKLQRGELVEVTGVIEFRIQGDPGGVWTLDGKHGEIRAGDARNPDLVVEISTDDWLLLTSDITQLMPLYFANRLRLEGNVFFATKLKQIVT